MTTVDVVVSHFAYHPVDSKPPVFYRAAKHAFFASLLLSRILTDGDDESFS